ncbi:MAG: hypothetical protein KY429_09345 [Actinobacteria bacterium]|nr:hypothetical protein [Actinomycetota bacterium]
MNSRYRRARVATLLILALVGTMPGFAFGSHTAGDIAGILGGFEIDGDFDFDGATIGSTTATRDWENVGDVTMSLDTSGTSEANAFKEGSKESEPNNWVIEPHNVPNKDDLTRAYAAADITASGQFLFLGVERLAEEGQGDMHINFELNQSADSIVNKEGTTIPQRTDGDLLVVYDYAGGQTAVSIELRLWDGIPDDPNTPENEEALFGQWILVTSATAVGDVNFDGPVVRPATAPFGGGTVDTLRFGEAAIDLSSIPGFLSCPGFSQFWAKSRASGESFDSALKDMTAPTPINLSTCGSIKVLKKDDSNNPLNGAAFELYNDLNNDNALDAGDTLAQTCTTGEEGAAGECTFEEVAPGEYVVKEESAPLGYVLDPTVSAITLGIRQDLTVAHTFIDPKIQYRLSLVPVQDTNLVNNDHVFTAHLEKCEAGISGCQATSGNWTNAAGETLGLSLAGRGSITGIVTGVISSASSGSCTTSAAGTCLITIRSPDAGRSTLTASFDKQTATTPIDLDTSAIKDWVNYRVTLCCEATNLVGTTHTFTAILERNTGGTAWTAVSGETLDISKIAGVGSISAIQAGTVSSPSSGTCTTDSAGSCLIDITSAAAGDTTIQAAYDAVVGNTSGTFSATAVKHWVNYQITVAPDGVNLVGQPHDFTVTLRQDTGSGFTALSGATVALNWAGVAGSLITSASGGSVPGDGLSATCVTGGAGTCTVRVNSSVAGSGTLTGTFSTVLDSGPASFDADATKQWVGYTISVTPKTDTNLLPVEPSHTFLVKLSSTNAQLAPIRGQTVNLALASSVATITAVAPSGSIATNGMSGTCITNSSGVCEVTISTGAPGEATLTATYETLVSSVNLTISDDGAKVWITYRVTVEPELATNLVGEPHTFTVKIESTTNGNTWNPVVGVKPDIGLAGVGSITGGSCISGVTTAQGTCTVIVSSSSTGVASVNAEYEATEGSASHTFSDSGQKVWINYAIEVTPAEAVNLVGTNHTFTVKIWKDAGDGQGFQILTGAVPSISLAGVGTIVANDCAAGTNSQGECTVVATSSTAGLATMTATYLGVADSSSAPFTDAGTKQWVDYRLDVSPEEADNPVNTNHVFTVTVEEDRGSGFQALAGALVDLVLTGVGLITEVGDGTIAADGRSATCTTDSSGQCLVTIRSAEPGQSTLAATHVASVAGVSRSFPDSGLKNWISNPAIQIVKTANPVSGAPGDPVLYTYVVTNIGDVTLLNITVDDDILGRVCVIAALEPGDSAECTKGSVLGSTGIRNVGTARGHDSQGRFVEDDDDAVVSVVLPFRAERPPPPGAPAAKPQPAAAQQPAVTGAEGTMALGVSGVSILALGLLILAYERRRRLLA